MDAVYTVTILENSNIIGRHNVCDPFHNTTTKVRGWRNAWKVLTRRYELTVCVDADRNRIEQVLELDPDYIGPAGSPSRIAWNAQLRDARHLGRWGAARMTQPVFRKLPSPEEE